MSAMDIFINAKIRYVTGKILPIYKEFDSIVDNLTTVTAPVMTVADVSETIKEQQSISDKILMYSKNNRNLDSN